MYANITVGSGLECLCRPRPHRRAGPDTSRHVPAATSRHTWNSSVTETQSCSGVFSVAPWSVCGLWRLPKVSRKHGTRRHFMRLGEYRERTEGRRHFLGLLASWSMDMMVIGRRRVGARLLFAFATGRSVHDSHTMQPLFLQSCHAKTLLNCSRMFALFLCASG